MSHPIPSDNRGSLWRNRDYLLLWSGQAISNLGSTASGVVFPLLILHISGSPAAAGIAGALSSIPYLLFSLPVGALIDRLDRKRIMILVDLGRALSLTSVPIAFAFNALTIWQLYINAFIEGSLFVFYNIAETASLPRVVPRHQLTAAYTQNQVADTVSWLAGPSLGAVLYQGISKMAPFIVDALSYVASVVLLLFIRTSFRPLPDPNATRQHNFMGAIREGISWWWRRPLLRFMAFLNSGLNLINGTLVIIVLAKNLGAQDADVGLILSVGTAGSVVGSLLGRHIQKRFRYGQAVPGVILYQAVTWTAIALSPNLVLFGIALAFAFASFPVYDAVQFTYRLAMIPDSLQGRVNSSFRLIAWGSRPIGAAAIGFLIEWIGARETILVIGAVLLLLFLASFANPHIRNAPPMESLKPEEPGT